MDLNARGLDMIPPVTPDQIAAAVAFLGDAARHRGLDGSEAADLLFALGLDQNQMVADALARHGHLDSGAAAATG